MKYDTLQADLRFGEINVEGYYADETPENILTFPELVGQLLIQCAIFESLKIIRSWDDRSSVISVALLI